jgi:hypothetical protein
VAWRPGFSKNTVPRNLQTKGWQVHKHPIGKRPHIGASVATALAA